ncbi:hypothetical protein Acr_09g0006710 [Actinidia rufa]|uniref:Pectinesterase inhibitor domain-containing protein n=1 Tax=Actinidia rufa TaxID=165716 RepID=A0A7J0F6A8_9ERIC|nr:hypothetical protein Acr_09g0006710 [Actinidia rufa]
MAQLGLSLLLLLLSTFCITGTTKGGGHPPSRARAFIVEQCQATLYPELCVQCLSNYPNASASQQELAQYALTMSLARAWYTRAYVTQVAVQLKQTKANEYQAVKDCLDQINDGVGQLSQSIQGASTN